MAIIQTENDKTGNVEKLETLYTAGGIVKW